jgi:hypothetical protein
MLARSNARKHWARRCSSPTGRIRLGTSKGSIPKETRPASRRSRGSPTKRRPLRTQPRHPLRLPRPPPHPTTNRCDPRNARGDQAPDRKRTKLSPSSRGSISGRTDNQRVDELVPSLIVRGHAPCTDARHEKSTPDSTGAQARGGTMLRGRHHVLGHRVPCWMCGLHAGRRSAMARLSRALVRWPHQRGSAY